MRSFTDLTSRLRQSTLIRNVLAVVTGSIGGQLIVFAFSPFITRIYSPEIFGLQGVFLSLLSVLSPIIALRYPMAIVVTKDEDDARRLARLSLLIAFGLSSVLGMILLVARDQVLALLGAEALGPLIWFLPLALFCIALQDVADFRAARLGAFRLVGIVTMVQAFITNLARVLGGLISPIAAILVAVTSLAPALQATLLRLGSRKRYGPPPSLTRPQALALLHAHRDFPLYRTTTDMLSAASQAVPVILLTALYSPAAAGLYVLARTVVNLPLNIIGSAIGNVFYSHMAEMSRNGRPIFLFVARSALALLLGPGGVTLLAALFFPSVFAFVFGEAWRLAGHYAQWMSLCIVGVLANIPAVRALPVIGKQSIHLIFNAVIMVGGAAGLLVGHGTFGTAIASVASFSIVTTLLFGMQMPIYLYLIRRHDRTIS